MHEVFLNDFNWETVFVNCSSGEVNGEIWWELCVEGNPYPQWFRRDDVLNILNLPNDFFRVNDVE